MRIHVSFLILAVSAIVASLAKEIGWMIFKNKISYHVYCIL